MLSWDSQADIPENVKIGLAFIVNITTAMVTKAFRSKRHIMV
jgi:hypothetical protein